MASKKESGGVWRKMSEELFQSLMAQMRNDGRVQDRDVGAVVPIDEARLKWSWNAWADANEEFDDDLSGEKSLIQHW